MRILGVDPGSRRTGWGVVEKRAGRLIGVAANVIVLDERADIAERLGSLATQLADVIAEFKPNEAAVEDVFQAKFARSALVLGQARGVVLATAANAGLKVHAYPPTVVKRAIAGSGRSEKDQVARLVGAILGLTKLPAVDATDALAVAIAHAQRAGAGPAARSAAPRKR